MKQPAIQVSTTVEKPGEQLLPDRLIDNARQRRTNRAAVGQEDLSLNALAFFDFVARHACAEKWYLMEKVHSAIQRIHYPKKRIYTWRMPNFF